MTLHATRGAALLSWVNSLHVADPVEAVLQLQDCSIFIKIIDRIHGTEEGQQILKQPVSERLDFVCSFLQKNRKHPSSPECLVSAQKVLEGSELELAKMTMLLLYHSTMSSKSPRDWEQFEYKIQAELAVILKFVLDHEDGLNLNEDLENFLQKAPVPSTCSSTFPEELSPPSHQAKREIRFLELQKVASSSSGNNFLSGSPASPMGDILQTPQFQMRRLKKQLADERSNRDELELELAENRKLLTEKDAQIAMMQQRIDRLALLNEKQAASPLEPKELEELRDKNESLTMRLHETLKQCQDLKTEKSQMDRKINQLSEENGDLSFKLREFASHLQQLQDALNELTEEHSKSTQEWLEKQAQLEKELSAALQDKKCLEEKNEILQGKLSQLEEHLSQLQDNPPQEKGEVLGDVLQVEELSKKLADSDQASKVQQQKLKAVQAQGGESQQEAQRLQAQLNELQAQLSQKEQAAEHYKLQMEKAKTHYDAKKQQNQELQEQLRSLEQLQKENKELRAEAERLGHELQQAGLKTKEAEQTCRHLTAQVRSLEAQVAHADQQLRDLGKFQVATDALKSREPQAKPQLDLSIDSLDLSCEEGTPLSITSKLPRTQPDGTSVPGEPASPISQRLPPKVESLESLYFTPIPARSQAPLESSLDSLGDVFLDSGRKTRSARRRTTQIINITMTKKLDVEEPDSANSSFYSTRSAPASQASLRATSSTQSLARLGSPDYGNSALLSLPGYRPTTRSSARRSQAGVSSGAPPGRNSFYMGTCQDEPEQLDDWNRIAELQQRNRVCPPHLKTCYPLESRPSLSLGTITDEEMKTGDPQETLRRASMQPIQIAEGTGITTRQQRKRVSLEPHQGPGTPESKKATSCFPRPMTPRDRHEGRKQSTTEAQKKAAPASTKQADRRQSMAFSILNTPKKLGNSLLRRGASKKALSKASPNTRSGTRRSPRIATTTASAATAATPRAKGKAKH
ncbi:NUMA1 isoform 15 [Pan troglodytes]|uniref:NUMA1 isoform 15 n=2 Tax=Pan troglodytes TaxID=9598 RepID=A0A6D2VVQ3_PANTR|nr:NUMA1 isoform 2 [Pan troglodytes]PNI89607.1 NUMA1 isoform 15 [Pan troglodytes]